MKSRQRVDLEIELAEAYLAEAERAVSLPPASAKEALRRERYLREARLLVERLRSRAGESAA